MERLFLITDVLGCYHQYVVLLVAIPVVYYSLEVIYKFIVDCRAWCGVVDWLV